MKSGEGPMMEVEVFVFVKSPWLLAKMLVDLHGIKDSMETHQLQKYLPFAPWFVKQQTVLGDDQEIPLQQPCFFQKVRFGPKHPKLSNTKNCATCFWAPIGVGQSSVLHWMKWLPGPGVGD